MARDAAPGGWAGPLASGLAHLARGVQAVLQQLQQQAAPRPRRGPLRRATFASLSASLAEGECRPARLALRGNRSAHAGPLFTVAAVEPQDEGPDEGDEPEAEAEPEPEEPVDAARSLLRKLASSQPLSPPAADVSGKAAPREERILISEVVIKGVAGELASLAHAALTIKPNFAYTLEEVQEDVNRVFQTGYFSNCQARVAVCERM